MYKLYLLCTHQSFQNTQTQYESVSQLLFQRSSGVLLSRNVTFGKSFQFGLLISIWRNCLQRLQNVKIQRLEERMEYNLRSRKSSNTKQNSSLRANKSKQSPDKFNQKTQLQTQGQPFLVQPQIRQNKKLGATKAAKKQLVTRKHIYNSKQITEIHDLQTGKSEFKSKTPIIYIMDNFNQIAKLGDNLLNVSPFSNNHYHQTEWECLHAEEKKQKLKTDSTMQNSQRQLQSKKCDSKELIRECKIEDEFMSKSEDLNASSRKTKVQRRSSSSDGARRLKQSSQSSKFGYRQRRKARKNY